MTTATCYGALCFKHVYKSRGNGSALFSSTDIKYHSGSFSAKGILNFAKWHCLQLINAPRLFVLWHAIWHGRRHQPYYSQGHSRGPSRSRKRKSMPFGCCNPFPPPLHHPQDRISKILHLCRSIRTILALLWFSTPVVRIFEPHIVICSRGPVLWIPISDAQGH